MEIERIKFELTSSPEILYRKELAGVAYLKHDLIGRFNVYFTCFIEQTALGKEIKIDILNAVDYPLLKIRQLLREWAEKEIKL